MVRGSMFVVGIALGALSLGCSGGGGTGGGELDATHARLLQVKAAYDRFTEAAGRPPRTESELLTQAPPEQREELLKSPRDGKPFVIGYGADRFDLSWATPDSIPALAHEADGVDGSRWVLTTPGAILEVAADDFPRVVLPPGR